MIRYSKKVVEDLIKTLDKMIDKPIEIIAIGGTALSFLGYRLFSIYIDLCYDCEDPVTFAYKVEEASRKLGIRTKNVEIFKGFEMSLLQIRDFSEKSTEYAIDGLENINFKIMNPLDIILSKIYRGEPKDLDDVRKLLKGGKIDEGELYMRFIYLTKYQDIDVRKEFMSKYEAFMKGYRRESK